MDNRRVLVPITTPVGGIRTYMLYNLHSLHSAGYRFTFLSYAGKGFNEFKKDVEGWEGTKFIDVPRHSRRSFSAAVLRALWSSPYALIHSQGLQAGTLTAAANLLRSPFSRWRTPHLTTLHDVVIPKYNDFGKGAFLLQRLIGFLLRRTSCIIPVSRDCEENHLAYFPAWNRGPVQIKTIRNGIDTNRLLLSQAAAEKSGQPRRREQLGLSDAAVIAGFYGRLMPQKGYDVLLQALGMLAERGFASRFRLLLTLDPNGYLKETKQVIQDNPKIADMVHFVEPVADITPLLLQSDVLLMPSRWEACPLLPMEAMVLGTPVVGSDCIGLREVLTDTPAVMFPSEDTEILADKIIRFIEQAEHMKNAARQFIPDAVKRFDMQAAVSQLLDLYQHFAPLR